MKRKKLKLIKIPDHNRKKELHVYLTEAGASHNQLWGATNKTPSTLQIKIEMNVSVCMCDSACGWCESKNTTTLPPLWIHPAVTQYTPPGNGTHSLWTCSCIIIFCLILVDCFTEVLRSLDILFPLSRLNEGVMTYSSVNYIKGNHYSSQPQIFCIKN